MILNAEDVPFGTRVFLDGVEQKDVLLVYPFKGMVEVYSRDPEDEMIKIGRDSFKTEVRKGVVNMQFPYERPPVYYSCDSRLKAAYETMLHMVVQGDSKASILAEFDRNRKNYQFEEIKND